MDNQELELVVYVNELFEEEKSLFNLADNSVLLVGDEYHDKISSKIEGYLIALKDFRLHDKVVPEVRIDDTNQNWYVCDFYRE